MDYINTIASYCGSISAIIALVVLIVKPLRNSFINWVTKTSNREELNAKIDNLTELLEKQVTQTNNMSEELKKQSMALQASLRDSILKIFNESMDKGFITMYEKENLAKLFEQYKNLGGNSFIFECYQELNNLPVRNN